MKYILFIFCLLSSATFHSQNQNPPTEIANSRAEYPGGETAFRKEFMKMVYGYVDLTAYAVNGKFSFIITIDEKGKMSDLKVYPKVRNDEEFKQDMDFAMRRIKKKWKPAYQNGVAVESKYLFEINFSSEHSDHEY